LIISSKIGSTSLTTAVVSSFPFNSNERFDILVSSSALTLAKVCPFTEIFSEEFAKGT
jgi:hypothetical protein